MNPRDRRALMVGGAVVVGAMLLLRGGPWVVRRVAGLRTRAVESTEAAERARQLLIQAPTLRDSLGRVLSAVVALAPKLVDTGTPAEAGAALAGQVRLLAGQSALWILRMDPLSDSSAGAFGRVAVRAELEGDARGLARFLVATETGAPVLTVSSFGVTAAAPTAPATVAEILRIEATISGLFLRRAAR